MQKINLKQNKPVKIGGYLLITILLTLGLSISLQSLLAAWTAPANNPPNSNMEPPVYNSESSDPENKVSLDYTNVGLTGLLTVTGNITTSGNVGIGTNNPQAALDLGNGTAGRSIIWGGSGGSNWYSTIGTSYSSGDLNILTGLKIKTTSDGYEYSYGGTYGVAGIRLDFSSGDIYFFSEDSASHNAGDDFTMGNKKMIIKSDGNVGIGIDTPGSYDGQQSKLDIDGYVAANDIWIKDKNDWASNLGGGAGGSSCRICRSCGGDYSFNGGEIQLSGVDAYGDNCEGTYHNVGTPTMYLCCK